MLPAIGTLLSTMTFPIQNIIAILTMDEDAAIDSVKGKGIWWVAMLLHVLIDTSPVMTHPLPS